MNPTVIDGNLLKLLITNGTIALRNDHQRINELNVFPVPDGDTGSNMQSTMMSGVKSISDLENESIEKVAKTLSRGLLMGARGNRGPTKDVVLVDKKTGEIVKEIEVGHVDYRAGHAPFAANEEIVVYPFGVQDIHNKPPVTQAFDRVIAKNIKTGQKLFEMY